MQGVPDWDLQNDASKLKKVRMEDYFSVQLGES